MCAHPLPTRCTRATPGRFPAGVGLAVAAAVGLVLTTAGRAQPSGVTPPPDPAGAPLPEGAVARLGSARFRFDGHPVTPVVFAPDGKRLAIGTTTAVFVFDADTGRPALRLPIPKFEAPPFLRFPADGRRLAVAHQDSTGASELTFVDLATGKATAAARFAGGGSNYVLDLAPDGSRALVVAWMRRAYLWDVRAGREVWSFPYPGATFVLPSGDGSHLAVVGDKRELHDGRTGKVTAEFPDPGRQFRAWHAALSPDGRIAVAAEEGDTVAILSAAGENRVRLLPSDRKPARFTFSPDSRYVAAALPTGTRVWDLAAPDDTGPVARLPGGLWAGFSPDGKALAVADEGSIVFYGVGDWKTLPRSADPPSAVWRVRFLDGGRRVLGYTHQGWVAWPAGGGECTRLSADPGEWVPVSRPDSRADALADVSADGRVAVDVLHVPGRGYGPGQYALRVTDLATGRDRRIRVDGVVRERPQVSSDGRSVSAFVGPAFVTWDAATGGEKHRLATKGRPPLAALAGPDGAAAWSVAGDLNRAGGGSGRVPTWTAVTVTDHRAGRSWTMRPVPWDVFRARVTPDGSRLVFTGRFGGGPTPCVSVWDLPAGRRLVNWDGEVVRLAAVDLSADGRSLLAGTTTGRLVLVEVATGGERAAFEHKGEVFSAAFSADGARAVSSGPDAAAYMWDLIGLPARWDPARADSVWADLASTDASVAFAAIRKLRAHPKEAVTFLRERVKVPAAPADEQVGRWLKDLDAPRFAAREQAQKELAAAADLIRPKLEAARKAATEEAGRRLAEVLKAADRWTPEQLRQLRACEVLEGVGTPDAQEVLRTWAAGPAGAVLTTEAGQSGERLRR